jgi:hypothetical protein
MTPSQGADYRQATVSPNSSTTMHSRGEAQDSPVGPPLWGSNSGFCDQVDPSYTTARASRDMAMQKCDDVQDTPRAASHSYEFSEVSRVEVELEDGLAVVHLAGESEAVLLVEGDG